MYDVLTSVACKLLIPHSPPDEEGAGVSLLALGALSLPLLPPLLPSALVTFSRLSTEAGFASVSCLAELRLSVMYQPLPLKITPTGWYTLRIGPLPQFRQTTNGSA